MTIYSLDFKIKVTQDYLINHLGYSSITREYKVSQSVARYWVFVVQEHGISGLKQIKNTHQPTAFKLKVINSMIDNKIGSLKAAAHFLISPASAKRWFNIYKDKGILGLKALEKKPDMPTDKLKSSKEKAELNELRKKLHQVTIERDILKKLVAVSHQKKNLK